jgi:hypothetical protein
MNNNHKRTISNPSDWFVSEEIKAGREYFQKWEKGVVQSNSA